MGEIRRAWRCVRIWRASLGRDHTPAAPLRHIGHRNERCGASGWRLSLACTDGNGSAICPVCSQQVRARPDGDLGRPVRVIQEHVA